jgi:hypothetical protein
VKRELYRIYSEVGIDSRDPLVGHTVRMVSLMLRSCWVVDLGCNCCFHRILGVVVEEVHIDLGLVVGILRTADLDRIETELDSQLEPVLLDYNHIQ